MGVARPPRGESAGEEEEVRQQESHQHKSQSRIQLTTVREQVKLKQAREEVTFLKKRISEYKTLDSRLQATQNDLDKARKRHTLRTEKRPCHDPRQCLLSATSRPKKIAIFLRTSVVLQ